MNQSLKKTNINFLCYKNEIAYCKEKIEKIQSNIWYVVSLNSSDLFWILNFSLLPSRSIHQIYENVFEKVLQ